MIAVGGTFVVLVLVALNFTAALDGGAVNQMNSKENSRKMYAASVVKAQVWEVISSVVVWFAALNHGSKDTQKLLKSDLYIVPFLHYFKIYF